MGMKHEIFWFAIKNWHSFMPCDTLLWCLINFKIDFAYIINMCYMHMNRCFIAGLVREATCKPPPCNDDDPELRGGVGSLRRCWSRGTISISLIWLKFYLVALMQFDSSICHHCLYHLLLCLYICRVHLLH